jgi:hypothetical protein
MKTAPAIKRIKPGSAWSDGMILDVAASKFCDLIPITRQVKMAERLGISGLPHQSLIESTHYLADFLNPIYLDIREEILKSKILYADETPHRMLEGDEKSNWYLWGFSSKTSAYYECQDTRSGDVAIELIRDSNCEYLMSDVYSGYGKTVKVVNEYRRGKNLPKLNKIYCNAHARRKFIEAAVFQEESKFFVECYQKIYRLDALNRRDEMTPIFEEMRDRTRHHLSHYSSKSAIVRASDYFLKNYSELTEFIKDPELPIDNNHQERLLRNPVIGRKTWYGTHSIRGAKTTAVLFSIIESCKLNKINPRVYLTHVVSLIHLGQTPPTPAQFRLH